MAQADRLHGETEAAGWGRLHPPGVVLAALFFTAALTPSLIPRDPVLQGVVCGVVAAVGYEIAGFGHWLWLYLGLRRPPLRWQRALRWTGLATGAAIIAIGLWRAPEWQNLTRSAAGLPLLDETYPLTIAGVAAAVFLGLWILARLFLFACRRIFWLLDTALPPRVGRVIGVGLALWLFWALVDGVLVRRALEAADASFEAADVLIEPDVPRPDDPMKAGSDASLVAWEEMGRWGRSFVSRAPAGEEIAEFTGSPAMDPLRVYVGRAAADTPRARARIALEELIRAGGFERSALVVMVPVGTGWMDPGGHDTLEFMLGGDVATVAVQYSYLTSALSLLVHPEYGVEQARVLFDVVYDHWSALPEDDRPKLYLHGLSQGAYNSERTLPLLDILADPIDGALWAGSPFFSPVWAHVRDNRNEGSAAWRPEFGNGSLVRTHNQNGAAGTGYSPWGPIRLVFLNYGSDPIVNFTFDSAVNRPGWLQEPRAPDVPEGLRWFPIVTMVNVAVDMAISLKVPRVGHFYVAPDYIDAWAAVVDPPDWSPERADELKAIFEARPPPF